jgi:hypothetical protein
LLLEARDASDDRDRGHVDVRPLGRPLVEDRIDRIALRCHTPTVCKVAMMIDT